MNNYNGYTSDERTRKLREMHRLFPGRSHPYYSGPCHMCGDPDADVAPHGEDYSQPYLWERPAVYALCRTCHGRLHKRFSSPFAWAAYKQHLRRGGYGSDLRSPPVARQVARVAKVLSVGSMLELPQLRAMPNRDDWWDRLTTDSESLTSPSARPRP